MLTVPERIVALGGFFSVFFLTLGILFRQDISRYFKKKEIRDLERAVVKEGEYLLAQYSAVRTQEVPMPKMLPKDVLVHLEKMPPERTMEMIEEDGRTPINELGGQLAAEQLGRRMAQLQSARMNQAWLGNAQFVPGAQFFRNDTVITRFR